jgi:hypothetical protein
MEIVAGENACYLLPAFISLKMEMSWRTTKIGKVRPNYPLGIPPALPGVDDLPLYKKCTQSG